MRDALLRAGLTLLLTAAMTILSPFASAQTVAYTYDDNGRLTTVDYGNGHVVSYVYDPANNTVRELTTAPENTLLVSVSPAASGTVSGNGIACPGDCSEAFGGTPSVSLTASPAGSWVLLGWSGDATGTGNPVSVTMTADRSAGCYFGASSGQTDMDGLDDVTEMGPNGNDPSYDGNHDGIPDYQQSNVASLPTYDGHAYASLVVQEPLRLSTVLAVSNPSPSDAPPGTSFPFGFFSFTIEGLEPGGCAVLDLFLPPAQLTSYFKYGPTADAETSHWYEFVHYHPALPGAEVWNEDGFSQARLFLCDAQTGDDVIIEDSQIIDVGGPSGILVAQIVVSPSSLDFGEIPASTTSELTVTVSSTGQDDLTIGNVAAANPLASPFSIVADACSGATLPNGASCDITVRYAPTDTGTFTDSFDIPSNDGANPTVAVPVSGSATQAPSIPTLDHIGLMILAILMACIGFDIIRRRLL